MVKAARPKGGFMAKVLVVDDNQDFCFALESKLQSMGHQTGKAHDLPGALAELARDEYEVVFLDVMLPQGNSLSAIGDIQSMPGNPSVVVITASGDTDNAEQAIRDGAYDYLVKPLKRERLEILLNRLTSHRAKRSMAQADFDRCGILGQNRKLLAGLDLLRRAADSRSNVLVSGETGTGKELFARAVHANSPRAKAAFVVVDCTNLPHSLAESLLFGHEKGSFTGADDAKQGLFKLADGGTLFLDEIGDLELATQKSLLRVLQEKKFRPLSAKKEVASDFRLVAATNRDLQAMVATGEFREDLYYRISSVIIVVPPLRERKSDIELLARHFIEQSCEQEACTNKEPTADFLAALREYPWPGNVRELVNAVETAVHNAEGEAHLHLHHLPTEIRVQAARRSVGMAEEGVAAPVPGTVPAAGSGPVRRFRESRQEALDAFEAAYLSRLVEQCEDMLDAGRVSGLSKTRLYELLQKHGIQPLGRSRRSS